MCMTLLVRNSNSGNYGYRLELYIGIIKYLIPPHYSTEFNELEEKSAF